MHAGDLGAGLLTLIGDSIEADRNNQGRKPSTRRLSSWLRKDESGERRLVEPHRHADADDEPTGE